MTTTERRDKAKEIVADYIMDAFMWVERLEGRGERFADDEEHALNTEVVKQVNRALKGMGYELKDNA